MNIFYFGSSWFSARVLEGILSRGIIPVRVITTPDKPRGRGLNLSATPVKEKALSLGMEVLSPGTPGQEWIRSLPGKVSCDLFLILSYGKIIPVETLSFPNIMPLGVHPSLLPAYRGAAPIQRVIINGEKETGVSLFKVEPKVDSGPVLLQERVLIEDGEDFFSLSEKLITASIEGIVKAVKIIRGGKYELTPQDASGVSYAAKLTKDSGKIDWTLPAAEILRLINGVKEWPGAYVYYRNKLIKITRAGVIDRDTLSASPGEIVLMDKEGLGIAAGKGILRIHKLKPSGKKEITSVEFIRGYRPIKGDIFR